MKSLQQNEMAACGPLEIYVDNLALRAFWVVQAWISQKNNFLQNFAIIIKTHDPTFFPQFQAFIIPL